MKNFQIITSAAIEAGLYTEAEALALIEKLGSLPLHTFAEWKRMGFQVKKGEKARLKVDIWKKSNKTVTITDGDGNETEAENGRFYKKLSHFFTVEQVERIA